MRDEDDIIDKCEELGEGNYYINEFIDKVAEYRVCVVQGRAVWVAVKTPGNPNDVAWNVNKGGRFDNVKWDDWPLKAVKKSIEAFNLSDLDFGGVDVMVDMEGECYILEINSAPSLTSPYRQECMAKTFDWIVNNGKARIPVSNERGGYTKFIHPAISENARLV
jgi:glutathione synthase/RimK-type ligase-like ATP-grasp enzyme